jgi:membrane-associated protease RseP (regulator of RpoE activity)
MVEPNAATGRRETRLLLATIAVSVLMLLLLARFRFPEEASRQTVEPAPAPLERLAARATYDELAGIMADLERRLTPSVTVLGLQSSAGIAYAPAVRLASDRAIAVLPLESELASTAAGPAPSIVSRLAMRELVVVQVEPGASAVPSMTTALRPGPRYIAALEATSRAPVIRPVYIGRTDQFSHPRWPEPVLSIGAVQQSLAVGAAIFSLDGGFIGLVSESNGAVTVVPADTLRKLVAATPEVSPARGALALNVQPLTPALARATGAERGVMVSYVSAAIPPSAGIASGDVIQSIDGTAVATVEEFQQAARSRTPGSEVALSLIRRGQPMSVTVTATTAGAANVESTPGPGVVLRSVPRIGSEVVDVQPGGAAARAGLRRGDLIVAVDGAPAPSPAQLTTAFRAGRPERPLLLTVRRDGDHVVIAVEMP